MGNTSSYDFKNNIVKLAKSPNSKEGAGAGRIDSSIRRLGAFLKDEALAEQNINGITPSILSKFLCCGNSSLGCAVFWQFGVISGACSSGGSDTSLPAFLTVDQFFTASHHFIGMISDSDQLSFFIRGFSRTGDQIERERVQELVQAAYEVAHLHNPELCPRLTIAVVDAAMHNKSSIGVGYLTKWCKQHCHRIVYWMHRHIANTLSSSIIDRKLSTSTSSNGSVDATDKASEKTVAGSTTNKMSTAENKSPFCDSFKPLSDDFSRADMMRRASMPVKLLPKLHKRLSSSSVTDVRKAIEFNLREANDDADEAEADTPVLDSPDSLESLLTPSLVWLLTCSLPLLYSKPKDDQQQQQQSDPATVHRRPSIPMMTAIHNMVNGQQPKHWEPLYISDRDGLGMNRFQHHVFNYRGPTLTLFTAHDSTLVFCLALDQEWKDSKNFWGTEDCRLLQIRPQYRVLEQGKDLMYFNLTWRGFPTGIQVGGNYSSRALTVNQDLSQLEQHNTPYTLDSVEVWGCGAKDIRKNQQEFKKRQSKDVEMRRKVKMTTADWSEHPDRYLLQMAGGTTSYANYDAEKPTCPKT